MRSNFLLAAACFGGIATAISPLVGHAQARPDVPGRIWGEFGIAAARHDGLCGTCAQSRSLGGPAVTASAGLTLDRGLGIAIAARGFQSFRFEYPRTSKYAFALTQYTLPWSSAVTVNAGAGYGRHSGDGSRTLDAGGTISRAGPVVLLGVAARVLPRSHFAFVLTADVVQSIGGSYRPRLLTIGIALNVSSGETYQASTR